MYKNGRAVFLTAFSFCCVLVCLLTFFVFSENKQNNSQTITELTFEDRNEITTPTKKEDVQAVSAGEAAGKIIKQTLTPYKANTAYNNVFVNNKTKSKTQINIENILKQKSTVSFQKNNSPQVLIVHTHTSESYISEDREYYTQNDATRTKEQDQNVVAVGKVFAEKLNNAGFKTLHDTTVHDSSYTGSYSRSADTIKKYLNQYKSIKLVIDIHRDSIADGENKIAPITKINGENAAQVMLVMGCGEEMDGFENWQQNLKFALGYQQTMEVMYPSLARAVTFLNSKYNQNLHTASILIEVGTEANSVKEALLGANYACSALISYMNTIKEQ